MTRRETTVVVMVLVHGAVREGRWVETRRTTERVVFGRTFRVAAAAPFSASVFVPVPLLSSASVLDVVDDACDGGHGRLAVVAGIVNPTTDREICCILRVLIFGRRCCYCCRVWKARAIFVVIVVDVDRQTQRLFGR